MEAAMESIEDFESAVCFDGLASGFHNVWMANIKIFIRWYGKNSDPDSIRKKQALEELLAHMDEKMPDWSENIEELEESLCDYAEENREFIDSISEKMAI
jgi:hypothetical protein